MTYNDFNCRINLPAWCESNGIGGQEFVRMPRFGWFAVDKGSGQIRSLMQFVPSTDIVTFCTDLILEKRQFHDGRIFYNEIAVARLCNDIRIMVALKRLHEDAVAEFNEGKVTVDGKTFNLAKMYNDNGMRAFSQTGVGYVSQTVFNTYAKPLALVKATADKLIIPTWCTPDHICSFETAPLHNPLKDRHTFYSNGEKGWYGRPGKQIVSDFKQLLTHPGCTWDPKLNYWAKELMTLSDSLTVKQLMTIWAQAQDIRFKQDPLDEVERKNGRDSIKHSVQGLSLDQLSELEKRFKLKLTNFWQAQKHKLVQIGNLTFAAKDMRYYVEGPNGTTEITNFQMEIHRIKKRSDGKYYRIGVIYYEGKQEPFEMPNDAFLSVPKLVKTITEFFLDKGLGVPIVSNVYRGYLLEIINRLNMEVMIDSN